MYEEAYCFVVTESSDIDVGHDGDRQGDQVDGNAILCPVAGILVSIFR